MTEREMGVKVGKGPGKENSKKKGWGGKSQGIMQWLKNRNSWGQWPDP